MDGKQPPTKDLNLTYTGPALELGRMSAEDAGRAIVAAARLIDRSSEVVLGGKGMVSLEVDAHFRQGSFDISLAAVTWAGEQVAAVSQMDLETVVKLVFGGGGLITVFKLLKGRKPQKVVNQSDGTVQFTINGENHSTTVNVVNLINDGDARDALRDLVAPLSKAGVDGFRCSTIGEQPVTVSRSEVEYFDLEPLPVSRYETEYVSQPVLSIVGLVYKEDNKWQFREGDVEFKALMADTDFWARVHNGEPLPEGTALRVEMVTRTQTVVDGTARDQVDRTITKVFEVIRSGQVHQLHLLDGDS